jgi:hypothetical protein
MDIRIRRIKTLGDKDIRSLLLDSGWKENRKALLYKEKTSAIIEITKENDNTYIDYWIEGPFGVIYSMNKGTLVSLEKESLQKQEEDICSAPLFFRPLKPLISA